METITHWIRSRTKTQRLVDIIQWPAIVLTSVWVVNPWFISAIIAYNEYAIIKSLIIWVLFYYLQEIISYTSSIKLKIPSKAHCSIEIQQKNQIDKAVEFILENNWLPVEKARQVLGRSWEKCKEEGDKLEGYGVMVKDKSDNNRRKLIERDPYIIWFALTHEKYTTTPTESIEIIEGQ